MNRDRASVIVTALTVAGAIAGLAIGLARVAALGRLMSSGLDLDLDDVLDGYDALLTNDLSQDAWSTWPSAETHQDLSAPARSPALNTFRDRFPAHG